MINYTKLINFSPPIPGSGGSAGGPRTPSAFWVFNGETLTITEFAQRVYGDTPQRTEFLLKYSDSDLKQAR